MSTINVKVWVLAARPKTLWASVAPVVIGTSLAFAEGRVHWLAAAMALFGAVMIQVGANYANDYFDYLHGADTEDRLGPVRATQAGLVKPRAMKQAFIITFAMAFAAGIYLVYRGGWPILLIGVFSILFGILYTGGPFPLGYYGLGDIFVLIFFGPVAVAGTYYVQALDMNWLVVLAGLSPGLLSIALLTVNNLRDVNTDRKTGKKTLAVRFGESFARAEYLLCILIACIIPLVLVRITQAHHFAISTLVVLGFALPSVKILFRERPGPIYNQALAQTGRLLLLFSLIFSVGWVL